MDTTSGSEKKYANRYLNPPEQINTRQCSAPENVIEIAPSPLRADTTCQDRGFQQTTQRKKQNVHVKQALSIQLVATKQRQKVNNANRTRH